MNNTIKELLSHISKKHFLLFSFILILALGLFLTTASAKTSQDAIAIRIIPNPNHYSALRWYSEQDFMGSPQSIIVNGYKAIRDGRTVYINAANITDNNELYTNIYLISYNQDTGDATTDIFGRILSHWRFNTNIEVSGECSISSIPCYVDSECGDNYVCDTSQNKCTLRELKNCLTDSDCPDGIFCNNEKSKIIRDTQRLSDLNEMKVSIEGYKNQSNRNIYPRLLSGTYTSGSTLSTWSSWQEELSEELGIKNLPIDPINSLGKCEEGHEIDTCWDNISKKFDGNIADLDFPIDSKIYFYYTEDLGRTSNYCANMETNYANIPPIFCFFDSNKNFAPKIIDTDLTGIPFKEFSKYIKAVDINNDKLTWSINTSGIDWINYGWSGAPIIQRTNTENQKKIYASKAGQIGSYPITIRVSDNQGLSDERVFNIGIMNLNIGDIILMGESKEYSVNGSIIGGNSGQIVMQNASHNGTPLSLSELSAHGFSIDQEDFLLKESFTSSQKTGLYLINLYVKNPGSTERIRSIFSLTVVNTPPTIKNVKATFSNNTTETCTLAEECTFVIDNGEYATLQVNGEDLNNGALTYSLVDNLDGAVSINSSTGVVSGLNSLNYQNLEEKDFYIKVRVGNQYCNNSSESECSTIKEIKITVQKYCSLLIPESTKTSNPFTGAVRINASGQVIPVGDDLLNCSVAGNSSVDIRYYGKIYDKVIIFVIDLSKSMETIVNGDSAMNQMVEALANETTGAFARVYDVSTKIPSQYYVKVGLVGYNNTTYPYDSVNIIEDDSLYNLQQTVRNYSTDYETKTLDALNMAETLFNKEDPASEKMIILMSDGFPGIDQTRDLGGRCKERKCMCDEGTWPDCTWTYSCTPCPSGERITNICSCSCSPITPPPTNTCKCGGTYPNCKPEPTNCECGTTYSGCSCINPCGSASNDQADFTIAITEQTVCGYEDRCCNDGCEYGEYCYLCKRYTNFNCDTSPNVLTQANYLKNMGVEISAIYYDTTNNPSTAAKMCAWSSNNGEDCDDESYFVTGTDIQKLFDDVLVNIVNKPRRVKVEGVRINDDKPYEIDSLMTGVNIDGSLKCGTSSLAVDFNDEGHLEFSNLSFDYCPAKLHP